MEQELTEQTEKTSWECPKCKQFGIKTDIILTVDKGNTKIECRHCKITGIALDVLRKIKGVRHTIELDYSHEFRNMSDGDILKISFEISQLIRDGWRNNTRRYAFCFINCECSKGLAIFRQSNRQLIANVYLKREVGNKPSQNAGEQK